MCKTTFALTAALLVAIVWIGLQGNQLRANDIAARPAEKKWEYHLEQLSVCNRTAAADLLNKFGGNGWELCSATLMENDCIVIFKRPKQ
jgi:hypothetical protein